MFWIQFIEFLLHLHLHFSFFYINSSFWSFFNVTIFKYRRYSKWTLDFFCENVFPYFMRSVENTLGLSMGFNPIIKIGNSGETIGNTTSASIIINSFQFRFFIFIMIRTIAGLTKQPNLSVQQVHHQVQVGRLNHPNKICTLVHFCIHRNAHNKKIISIVTYTANTVTFTAWT